MPLGAGRPDVDGREGWRTLGFVVAPVRAAGTVTPGMTSIGRTDEGAATGGETGAVDGGGVDGRVGGALAFDGSGSDAGPSSGGGSWARARLVPQRTTQNDRTMTARNMGQVSRQRRSMHGYCNLPNYIIGSNRSRNPLFLGPP